MMPWALSFWTPTALRRRLGLAALVGAVWLGPGLLFVSVACAEEDPPPVEFVPLINFSADPVDFAVGEDGDLAVITDRNSVRVWHRRVIRRIVRGHAFVLGPEEDMVIASPGQGTYAPYDFDRADVLRFWPPRAEAPSWELDFGTAIRKLHRLESTSAGDSQPGSAKAVPSEVGPSEIEAQEPWLLVLGPRRMSLLARNRQALWTVEAPQDTFFRGFFVSEQAGLLGVSQGKSLELYDLRDGRRRLSVACDLLYSLDIDNLSPPVISPDGRSMAAFCGRNLEVWRIRAEAETLEAELLTQIDRQGTSALNRLAMHPSGRFLATGGTAPVRMFDLELGSWTALRTSTKQLSGLVFSSSGDRLLVSDWFSGTRIWDLSTRKKVTDVEALSTVTSPRFEAEDRLIQAVSGSGIATFNAETGKLISFRQAFPADTYDLAFSPDGRSLASQHRRQVRLWSFEDGTSTALEGQKFAWTEDGSHLLIGPSEGRVQVLRAADQRVIGELREDRPILTFASGWADGISGYRSGSPNRSRSAPINDSMPWATLAATASADGTVSLWDAATARRLRRLDVGPRATRGLLISASSGRLVVISSHSAPKLFDLTTGRSLAELDDGGEGRFDQIRISPDGRRLALGRLSSEVTVWRMADGSLERRIRLPKFGTDGLLFLDADRLLVARSVGKTPFLIDLSDPNSELIEVPELDTHKVLLTVSSSEQGMVSIGSKLGAVETWRFNQGTQPSPAPIPGDEPGLARHVSEITGLSWSPGGRYLASGDREGVIWLWDRKQGARGWLLAVRESNWGVISHDGYWDGPASHRLGIVAWREGKVGPLRDLVSRRRPGLLKTLLPHLLTEAPPRVAVAGADRGEAADETARVEVEVAQLAAKPAQSEARPLEVLDSALIGGSHRPVVAKRPGGPTRILVDRGTSIGVLEIGADRTLRELRRVTRDGTIEALRFLATDGRRLYAGYEREIYSMDLEDPEAELERSLTFRKLVSHGLWWRHHLVVALQDEMRRFRPLDQDHPPTWGSLEKSWLGYRTFSAHHLAVDGDLLLFSSSSSTTRVTVVDTSDSEAPEKVGVIAKKEGSLWSLALEGTLAALAHPGGVAIVDLSEPGRPRELGRALTPMPRAVALRGGRLYVADDHLGLRVFSLENPSAPKLLAELELLSTDPNGHGSGLVWAEVGWILSTRHGIHLVADPFED